MTVEIVKFFIYAMLIVMISKFMLVKALRKLSKSLNLRPRTIGNIAGVATSIPEFLTVTVSSFKGLASTSLYNILSSNIINFIQYILSIIINKNYKMDGLILADVNVIRMMDDNLEVGKSDTIPVTLNDDGNINFKNSKVVTKEEFEALQSYTIKIIKEISKEILDGNIKLKPYYIVSEKKSPCTYCEYKSICQFNPRFAGNEYLYVTNKPRQEILDEICKRNSKT